MHAFKVVLLTACKFARCCGHNLIKAFTRKAVPVASKRQFPTVHSLISDWNVAAWCHGMPCHAFSCDCLAPSVPRFACACSFKRNVLAISRFEKPRGGTPCVWRSSRSILGIHLVRRRIHCLSTEVSHDFTGFPCETRLRILRYRIWIQLGVDFFYLPLGSGSHLFCDLPREGGLWSVEEFTRIFTREWIARLFSLWCAVLVVRLASRAQLCGPKVRWSDTAC